MSAPSSVLFACTTNSVRSPMAEALLKHHLGLRVYVDSVGVRPQAIDPLAIATMAEKGLDLSGHRAKSFDDLEDTSFDLVISLSPEAHHHAVELTRGNACELLFWPTFDATAVEGSLDARMAAFRSVRDSLIERIDALFPASTQTDV
jgi:protein-tyrosine-phosphatase